MILKSIIPPPPTKPKARVLVDEFWFPAVAIATQEGARGLVLDPETKYRYRDPETKDSHRDPETKGWHPETKGNFRAKVTVDREVEEVTRSRLTEAAVTKARRER